MSVDIQSDKVKHELPIAITPLRSPENVSMADRNNSKVNHDGINDNENEVLDTGLYEPLSRDEQEIRLLQLQGPFAADSPVRCTLQTVSLDTKPEYWALSYMWGKPTITENIIINGRQVAVTINLALALKQSGLSFGSVSVWADAVCIDQHNLSERSQQVSIMRRIYEEAQTVISWVGLGDETSKYAINLMDRMGSVLKTQCLSNQDFTSFEDLDTANIDLRQGERLADFWKDLETGFQSIVQLFERPYWSRLWVFQELLVAKSLQFLCGPDIFKLSHMDGAVLLAMAVTNTPGLVDPGLMHAIPHSPLLEVFRRIRGSVHNGKPAYIFALARTLLATNPRDHVYGLLGLMNIILVPDYSMSVREVYCSLASAWITQSHRLDVLKFSGIHIYLSPGSQSTTVLPSWVPDWKASTTAEVAFHLVSDCQAAGDTTAQYRISADLGTLYIQGIECDKIISVVPKMFAMGQSMAAVPSYFWSMAINPIKAAYPTGTSRLQAAFQLILVTMYRKTKLDHISPKLQSLLMKYVHILSLVEDIDHRMSQLSQDTMIYNKNGEDKAASQPLFKEVSQISDYFKAIIPIDEFTPKYLQAISEIGPSDMDYQDLIAKSAVVNVDRSPFHTANGYIGMAPHCVSIDDVVCVIPGADNPVILRKMENHYVFVSECIVIGLMDGEAIQATQAGELQSQEFEIR
jgi:hypothetical protein